VKTLLPVAVAVALLISLVITMVAVMVVAALSLLDTPRFITKG
jgi:hypothetical protein